MFIHVIPKMKLRRLTGVLTYQTDKAVRPGQLVAIKVRGRKIPGLVAKIKVPAGAAAKILAVHQVSAVKVPDQWQQLVTRCGRYYDLNVARSLAALAPAINLSYLQSTWSVDHQAQKLIVTPSSDTPLARTLARQTVTVPQRLPERRALWLTAAAGQPLTALGSLAAAALPFANLREVLVDSPFVSPYTDERSPGLNAAWVALQQGLIHRAALTIRSVVPLELLTRYWQLPPTVTVLKPPLHPINLLKARTTYQLNDSFLREVADRARTGQRVLIYANYDSRPLALEIQKKTGLSCSVWQHGQPARVTPVTLATSTILFSQSQFDHAFIPAVEQLISPLRPTSTYEALEVLGIIAARSPVTAQYIDGNHWLVRALRQNFVMSTAEQARIPTFGQRLIIFNQRRPAADQVAATISRLWPKTITGQADGQISLTAISDEQLTEAQRLLIATLPTNWSVKTRALTLPKLA